MSCDPRPTIIIPSTIFDRENQGFGSKTIILGQHRIVINELIGLGCQGNVYAAISNLHGNVAVKEIPKIIIPDIHYKAESLGVGPIIFDVYYESNAGGTTYIIMERLHRTLTLKDISDPTSSSAVAINNELCESVTLLMEHGIFHNDLRDTNVMFSTGSSARGNLRIIDYDSAKMAFAPLAGTSVLGTSDDMTIPLLSEEEYDKCLKNNYHIYISGKKYVLNYHYLLQQRHHKARDKYMEMLESLI
jgi:serine/threonine protein kinase